MYKVFINNRPFILAGTDYRPEFIKDSLMVQYDSPETLKLLMNLAHTEQVFFSVVFLIGHPDEMMNALIEQTKIIEAAGGVVRNQEGKILMIFRNERWDLPKGKLDKGEKPEDAAVREVSEECGISKPEISRPLPPSYHTFMQGDKIVLKKTYWYDMQSTDSSALVPQQEEGITDVRWMSKADCEEACRNTFHSVVEVLKNSAAL